ncbi:enterochelin esterase [Ktedonosporobacter rubrisoli]|uniref:Enterochelin esterase n=1 Tax=Ktedonosporobacter rubrisoli TaxID=2509675 RepID=A0A4P6JKB1_KTERU|nr:enterochelin esterase [Ktedonosporobacter rubrisoli]QBD75585.1 enterochelin esterase [Ktedonosporobacter rubrisoli]
MEAKEPLESPRLNALLQALEAGDSAELANFWQEIAQNSTPLIEPIEGDASHYLATFLWRGKEDIHNVVVFAGPAGWDHPQDNQMTRLRDTDLWYKTYRVKADLRVTYLLSPNDPLTRAGNDISDFGTRLLPDPLNHHQFVYQKDDEVPDDKELVVSVLELPGAPAQPWIVPQPSAAKGQLEMHRVRSHILNNERRVWIYTPPGYTKEHEAYNLLLLFDGLAYTNLVPTPTILDNLINEGKLPPLVAVLPDSLDQETRSRELPCHQPFVDFLTQELLPWVHERYHVTSDPARSIVAGSSYGGLAAAFVGLRASERFGNVLSQSGSYWWDIDAEEQLPQERLAQQFIASPRLPLRFYLEVGSKENIGSINMISSNRHLRDILTLKGYEVHYTEFNGGHDYICWRGSLADGLLALTRR